jgi:hypothetical protein
VRAQCNPVRRQAQRGVPAEHAARRAAQAVEHVECNTNADVAYLFRPPRGREANYQAKELTQMSHLLRQLARERQSSQRCEEHLQTRAVQRNPPHSIREPVRAAFNNRLGRCPNRDYSQTGATGQFRSSTEGKFPASASPRNTGCDPSLAAFQSRGGKKGSVEDSSRLVGEAASHLRGLCVRARELPKLLLTHAK